MRGAWAIATLVVLGACQAPLKLAVVPPVTETPGTIPEAASSDPATAALPPEPMINDDPRQLMGLGPRALRALLGEPELVRREVPAEIWQYRTESCVFDVFLYDSTGQRKVTYVEARDGAALQIETRACLNGLLRARPVQPLG